MNLRRKLAGAIHVSIFIIIFLSQLVAITYGLRRDSDIKQRFAGFYHLPQDSLDVVYIGSSPVHPYWAGAMAWEEQGFTSWPLSTNLCEKCNR